MTEGETTIVSPTSTLGSLWSWGDNYYGQTGHNITDNGYSQLVPKRIENTLSVDTQWGNFSCGLYHAIGIISGKMFAWGNNDFGQSGRQNLGVSLIPYPIAQEMSFTKVCCGDFHTLALSTDGSVYSFGKNDRGQLGTGNRTFQKVPTKVLINSSISVLSCSAQHSCAISTDGTLFVWGNNSAGQLGLESTADILTPIPLEGTWSWVSTGQYHTLAIKTDGTLWGWGLGEYGQLGGEVSSRIPIQITGVPTPTKTSCGIYHSLVLSSSSVYSSGYGLNGQLGNGVQALQLGFGPISSLTGVVDIFAWGHYSLVAASGGLYYFGDNSFKFFSEMARYVITPTVVSSVSATQLPIGHGGGFIIVKGAGGGGTPLPSPIPSPAPEPEPEPEELPEPGSTPTDELPSERETADGPGGYVFKPISESDSKLVILINAKYVDIAGHLSLLKENGEFIEKGLFWGPTNGDRPTYRFKKPGKDYPSNIWVRADFTDGTHKFWFVPNPSQRYD